MRAENKLMERGALVPAPGQLPVFEYKGQLVADSRDVAPFAEKDHAHLLRDIRRYVKALERFNQSKIGLVDGEAKQEENPILDSHNKGEISAVDGESKHPAKGGISVSDYFIEAFYISEQGKRQPRFYCTEMGCEMVANKMTGDKGVIFTALYVKAFHAMRDELAKRRELRAIGKPARRSMTDALRDSGEVERMKGHAYGTYTDLAYKLATGKIARQLRKERGAEKTAKAVDILTAAELEEYQRKEAAITVLLDAGLRYDAIKALLIGKEG